MNIPDSPAAILRTYFLDKRIVSDQPGTRNFPVYLSTEPEEPENCITIYDQGLLEDGRLMEGELIEHPECSIRIRSKSYSEGWTQLNTIAKTIEDTVWKILSIKSRRYRIQSITLVNRQSIGRDANDRSIFTGTVRMTINYLPTPA